MRHFRLVWTLIGAFVQMAFSAGKVSMLDIQESDQLRGSELTIGSDLIFEP